MNDFTHVIQPSESYLRNDIPLKGKWNRDFFKNNNPIVLELGCGKGEYALELVKRYPKKNFIGIDIKGNRMYIGAEASNKLNLKNIGFLRVKIEDILHCFDIDEISEIWITFPDPQIKKRRQRKRLTHPDFINKYNKIINDNGVIHLKTDSKFLYGYTLGMIHAGGHNLIDCSDDIYGSDKKREDLDINTYYENMFISKKMKITYIRFSLKYII